MKVPPTTLPLVSTVKRLEEAALFWAWIRKPDGEVSVFLFKYKPYEVEELPFSVNWIPVEVVFPLPVTEARVSASVVRQEAQVMVKDRPGRRIPRHPAEQRC